MAVVGHAYVVVRAITDKVEQDIKKAFRALPPPLIEQVLT